MSRGGLDRTTRQIRRIGFAARLGSARLGSARLGSARRFFDGTLKRRVGALAPFDSADNQARARSRVFAVYRNPLYASRYSRPVRKARYSRANNAPFTLPSPPPDSTMYKVKVCDSGG